MAFQDFRPHLGIAGSKWVGWLNFKLLFEDQRFYEVIRNTLAMNLLKLLFGFISAVGLAVILNEVRVYFFKRVVQTISYLPHFVSWVVAGNIIISMLSRGGPLNQFLLSIGILQEPILWLGQKSLFWLIIALTDVWKEVGWNAIIYLAAIASIDPVMYEAADIDGAGRIKKIFYITIPSIMPTIKIIFVMNIGWVLSMGFYQQYVLNNSLVAEVGEVLQLYVIKYGINMFRFSYATAAGIFQTVVSLMLVFIVNKLIRATD